MTTQGKHGADAGTEELRQEVDRARHDLGDTVEQLAAKADVKAMAREKIARVRGRARDTATSTRDVAARARGEGSAEQAKRGGAVVMTAGALALGAVLIRRRRHAAHSGTGLRQGLKTRMPSRPSRHGRSRLGRSRHGKSWPGKSWSGTSRRGKSRWDVGPVRVRMRPWRRGAVRGRRRRMFL